MSEKRIGTQFSLNFLYLIDSILGTGFFSFLLISWIINVFTYNHVLLALAIFLLVILILSLFIIDWILISRKKGFILQAAFNFFLLALYTVLLSLFTYILQDILYFGFFIFTILAVFKIIRIGSLINLKRQLNRENRDTKITLLHFKRRKPSVIFLIVLFCFPLVVFLTGLTPYSVAFIEIEINNQQGTDEGSNEIQLSFYATLGSYEYLTDEKVLAALNGTDFGEGELPPVEVL